ALEDRGQAVALHAQGVVGAVALAGHEAVEPLQQLRVVQEQGMQVEELAHFGGQGAVQPRAQVAELVAHVGQRFVQAQQFAGHRRPRDPLLGHLERVRLAHPRPAEGIAPRRAQAGEELAHQPSSSKRRPNRAVTASAAAASSAPSTRRVTVVPVPAASSITPMMLLAFTSRPFAVSVASTSKSDSSCTRRAVARACSPSRLETVSSRVIMAGHAYSSSSTTPILPPAATAVHTATRYNTR